MRSHHHHHRHGKRSLESNKYGEVDVVEPSLPRGWEARFSKTNNRTYYVHPRHGASWTHPAAQQQRNRTSSSYPEERGSTSRSSRRHHRSERSGGGGSDIVHSTSSRPSTSSSSANRMGLHRQNSHSTPSSSRFSRSSSRNQSPKHFRGSRGGGGGGSGIRTPIPFADDQLSPKNRIGGNRGGGGGPFGSFFRSSGPPRDLNIPLDAPGLPPYYLNERGGDGGYLDSSDIRRRESRNDRKTNRAAERRHRIPPDIDDPDSFHSPQSPPPSHRRQRDRDYPSSSHHRRRRFSPYDRTGSDSDNDQSRDDDDDDDDDDHWDGRRRSRPRSSSRGRRRSNKPQPFEYVVDDETQKTEGDRTIWGFSYFRNRSADYDHAYSDKEGATTFDEATTLNDSLLDADTADFHRAPRRISRSFWRACC